MPKRKREPQRTCIGCGRTTSKRELIRIVRTPEGEIKIDPTGKVPGRGAYLCPNKACWQKALKKKRIGTALKTTLTEEALAQIQAYIAQLPEESPEPSSVKSEGV
ncbi:MAG: YlxR family protein [Anaerolineae bacterium]|nr:YlxR family protein [Anaerolineae bacterium]